MNEPMRNADRGMRNVPKDSEALQMAYLVTSREEVWRLKDSLLAWRIAAVLGWITVFIMTAIAARGSVVTKEFLDAMECIESGMDARAVGDQGRSRGSYQFKAVAWAQVNSFRAAEGLAAVPYLRGATNRVTARLFAECYLRWLESHLAVALRRSPSRPELYAAWNLGPSGFRARGFLLARCPVGVRDAAGRLENLVRKLNHG